MDERPFPRGAVWLIGLYFVAIGVALVAVAGGLLILASLRRGDSILRKRWKSPIPSLELSCPPHDNTRHDDSWALRPRDICIRPPGRLGGARAPCVRHHGHHDADSVATGMDPSTDQPIVHHPAYSRPDMNSIMPRCGKPESTPSGRCVAEKRTRTNLFTSGSVKSRAFISITVMSKAASAVRVRDTFMNAGRS